MKNTTAKKIFNGVLCALILVVSLAVTSSLLAQGPRGGGPGRGGMGPGMGGDFGGMFLHQLNLTDDQKAQIKVIRTAGQTEAQPIQEQLKALRPKMETAIQAGDTTSIGKLASDEGTYMGQLAAIRANTQAKIYALLTADQKAQLAKLQAEWEARMEERKNNPPNN